MCNLSHCVYQDSSLRRSEPIICTIPSPSYAFFSLFLTLSYHIFLPIRQFMLQLSLKGISLFRLIVLFHVVCKSMLFIQSINFRQQRVVVVVRAGRGVHAPVGAQPRHDAQDVPVGVRGQAGVRGRGAGQGLEPQPRLHLLGRGHAGGAQLPHQERHRQEVLQEAVPRGDQPG